MLLVGSWDVLHQHKAAFKSLADDIGVALCVIACVQIKLPNGSDGYEPCAPLAPGAQECTLQYFADKGIADQVGLWCGLSAAL